MIAKGWGRYRWLDYPALMTRYMRGEQRLAGVKLFTSHMEHQPERFRRQVLYLKALKARGGIEIVAGQFTSREVRCKGCAKRFRFPQEKRTDVNLATHLLADAFNDRFDTFLVATADSDLIPAIAYVQAHFEKQFILLDPPRRHSDELAEIADVHLHSREQYYRQSQLPDPVEYVNRRGKTRRIYRPPSWVTSDPVKVLSEPDHDGIVYCMACSQPLPIPAGDGHKQPADA